MQVGDPAIAIGNPFGLDRTLTTGVISAVQRTIQAPNGFAIDDVLQTDAAINPGNSGGPLIDASGQVIGINSQIETGGSGSSGNVGIGFAVPIDTAKQIIPELKKPGASTAATWASTGATIDKTLKDLNLPVDHGALVQSVRPAAPPRRRASAPATSARRSTTTRSSWAATSSPRSTARTSAATTTSRRPSPTASRATRSRSRWCAAAR